LNHYNLFAIIYDGFKNRKITVNTITNNNDDENNDKNIDIMRKTINVKTLVRNENKIEIKELLNQRQNKIKMLNFINVIQIFLLLIGACMWFLTTSFRETSSIHNILSIISGMYNVIFLWFESYKKMLYKQLNSIKTTIKNYNDTNSKNEL